MQLSTTATRWLAFASLPGGVLLALAWSIPAAFLLPNMFAADVRNVAGIWRRAPAPATSVRTVTA